jgi:hypothetical protein
MSKDLMMTEEKAADKIVEKEKFRARRFYLYRKEDVSGVSGTGKVAEGLEFVSGMCALSFLSEYQHVNIYANMRALELVHGHEGRTQIVFID